MDSINRQSLLFPKPLIDIRRSDVHELLDSVVAAGRQGTAREIRKHLSRLFSWAVDREIIGDSPTTNLKRSDLQANGEAGRALNDQELKFLWKATLELGYPFGQLYRVLILTGQRRNDWASAVRTELNNDRLSLEIPKTRYKSDRDHVVPLSPAVWDLLGRMPINTLDPGFIFSTTRGAKPVSGFSKAKTRLNDAMSAVAGASMNAFRVHDFRVTCETRLAGLGFNQEIRDAVLGHARPGLQKTYNKYDYYHEKQRALAAYSLHVRDIVE